MNDFLADTHDPVERLDVASLTLEIAQAMSHVPRAEVPDMPDRIVAATAVAHGLPRVSQDSEIRSSVALKRRIRVIW